MKPLLEVRNIVKRYKKSVALNGVSLEVYPLETVALAGESGCGKSTLAKIIMNLITPTLGTVFFKEKEICSYGKALFKQVQMIFQDPYSSLNPRMTVEKLVGEPLSIHNIVPRSDLRLRVSTLLESVGLDSKFLERYPYELSGGQRQRICIARALAVEPKLLICDEPVSSLDAITQDQVIKLFQSLKKNLELTLLFISHDLSLIKQISDRLIVMYLGQIMEVGSPAQLFANPSHPYTQALLSAIPIPDPILERKRNRILLMDETPAHPVSGCSFHTRCPFAKPICRSVQPPLVHLGNHHFSRCHFTDTFNTTFVPACACYYP